MKQQKNPSVLKRARNVIVVIVAFVFAISAVGCGSSSSTSQSQQNASQSSSSTALGASFSSWAENSASLKKLTDFVSAATDEKSPNYIPPEDRIVATDLDGTLMCETYPWCFEYMVFADYALNNPNYQAPEEVASVAKEIIDSAWGEKPSGMSTRQAQAAAIAYQGLKPAQLEEYVNKFKTSAAEGFSGLTRAEAFYKPMVEIVDYLKANGFDIYVVTATERNIVRALVADSPLNIDPTHVIGTEYGYKATGQGDEAITDYTFKSGDEVVFDGSYAGENAKMSKVAAITREIGKQPVLSFGNSSGDEAMLTYVISGNKYPSASFMVLDDDEAREYGDADGATEKREKWEKTGYTVFSMRDDFKTIYGEGVQKAPVKTDDTTANAA